MKTELAAYYVARYMAARRCAAARGRACVACQHILDQGGPR
jgi:hypothetical protein